MMAVRDYYGLTGTLTDSIAADAVLLPVTAALSGAIAANFVNGEDVTWLALVAANKTEVVKVYSVDGSLLSVERGQQGTVAQAFAIGSVVSFRLTADSIIARLPALPSVVSMNGTGLAQVTEEGIDEFTINVPAPEFKGDNGIEVLGMYPQLTFTLVKTGGECCGEGGGSEGDAITNVLGEGLAIAFVNGGVATIRVPPPTFNAGANIQITGAWPNYTISGTAGSGTVSSVGAGAGLQLTGSPSVNPTLSISNTGVVAGLYGGININARGQIVTVPATFNPISILETGDGLTESRVGDKVTLTPRVGSIGVSGILALADPDDAFDPNDDATAASPAVVGKALETLITADVTGVSSYTPETGTDYTGLIGASATSLLLLSGQKALVRAGATMVDGTDPDVGVSFGLGVFDGSATLVKGNRKIKQCNQSMEFILTGPLNTVLTLATTAIPAGATVQSYSLSIVVF